MWPAWNICLFCWQRIENKNQTQLDPRHLEDFTACLEVGCTRLFVYFLFKFFASLRFSNFRFEIFALHKKNFCLYSIFLTLFRFPISFQVKKKTFSSIFSLNFCFASIFCLIFAYFTFVFASDFWCFALGFFFRFQAIQNFCFNFKFCFRSESEGAPYLEEIYVCATPSYNLQHTIQVFHKMKRFNKM